MMIRSPTSRDSPYDAFTRHGRMMQALWSRVSCRCPQCAATAAQGVARSATTSAARRPAYWTSSTLWYSGIFAAAATYDAKLKIQRREQWNQAIAEVKQELGDEELIEAKVEVGVRAEAQNVSVFEEEDALRELESSLGSRPSYKRGKRQPKSRGSLRNQELCRLNDWQDAAPDTPRKTWDNTGKYAPIEVQDDLRELDAFLDSTSQSAYRPVVPSNTGPDLVPSLLPPQSIYAPWRRKARLESQPWHDAKIGRHMISVDVLLMDIFRHLRKYGHSEEAAQAVPDQWAEKILMPADQMDSIFNQKRRDQIHAYHTKTKDQPFATLEEAGFQRSQDDVPLCHFQETGTDRSRDTCRALNNSLRRLFHLTESGSLTIPALLAKVSYNISSSSAAPNIDTYNTLLVGLSNLKEVEVVKHVIQSFRASSMRPNEVSLVAILNYHTVTGNADQFRYWVQLMRGKHGGLSTARTNVTIDERSKSRLIRMPDGKVIQLPYPTPLVFGALIKGVLKFSGFEAALEICKSMSTEGWGLSISGFGPLLKDCADRRDWTAGLAVWQQIQALKLKSRQYVRKRWITETISLATFASMLRLCSRCDQRDIFEDVMDQASHVHPRAVTEVIHLVKKDRETPSGMAMPAAEANAEEDNRLLFGSEERSKNAGLAQSVTESAIPQQENTQTLPETLSLENISSEAPVDSLEHKDDGTRHSHMNDDVEAPAPAPETTTPTHRKARGRVDDSNTAVLQDHLIGGLPMPEKLEQYETRERPMRITD